MCRFGSADCCADQRADLFFILSDTCRQSAKSCTPNEEPPINRNRRARSTDVQVERFNRLSRTSIVQRTRWLTRFPITNAEMLFYSFFKTLVAKKVTIELKNDLKINGVLHSVDQYLNIKLTQVDVVNPGQHPHLSSVTSVFIRGSVVRYVHIDPSNVDVTLLQDATRREYREGRNPSS